jgi:hypothetical protein
MADAKQQDKSKEKKEPNSEGVGFKTVMGGFDKNEVNLYINKLKKQMKKLFAQYRQRSPKRNRTLNVCSQKRNFLKKR